MANESEGKNQQAAFEHEPKAELSIKNETSRNLLAKGNRVPDPAKRSTAGPSRKANVGPLATKIYYDDVYYSSRTGDEASYYDFLRARSKLELWNVSQNLERGEVKLTVAKVNVKGTLAHGQVDLVEALGNLLFPPPPAPVPPPFEPPPPRAARLGDPTCHGNPLGPGSASTDVLIGGLPAWRASVDVHLCAMAGHGSGATWSGASNVVINGFPAARAGDYVLEPGGGNNVILGGCSTVLIGPRARQPPTPEVSVLPDELPWVKLEALLQEDVGMVNADAGVAVEIDAEAKRANAALEAGGVLALAAVELPLRLRIRVPSSALYLGLGVAPYTSALSLGMEGGAGVKIDAASRRFELSAGAKANLGLGGAGTKFSIDLSE